MRLFDLFKKPKDKKVSMFTYESSYSVLLFNSDDSCEVEEVWNATNLPPPRYIYSKDKSRKLYYVGVHPHKMHIIEHVMVAGERYITYKLPEEFVRQRKKLAKHYWDSNYNECNAKYLDFEEFFVLSCKSMNKPRFEVKEVTE